MKQPFIIVIFFLSVVQIGCTGQTKKIKISEARFESIFAYPKDSSRVYCLLGSGFFRAPRSNNVDSIINDWLHKHPDAFLLPVSQLKDGGKMTYCWVIDNKDTLNTVLIRNGCYPGGTMVGPRKNTSMSEVYISNAEYNNFIEQIKIAEGFAKQNKLGIWIKEDPFE